MTFSSPSRARLVQTASDFISSYNTWTVESIISIRSPSCAHHTLPATLNVPSRSTAEYAIFIALMLSIFRGVQFTIIDDRQVVVDVEARKVVLHCRNRADTAAGDYRNEYMFTLTMSENGLLVDEIVEFIDAAYTADFKLRVASAMAAKDAGC